MGTKGLLDPRYIGKEIVRYWTPNLDKWVFDTLYDHLYSEAQNYNACLKHGVKYSMEYIKNDLVKFLKDAKRHRIINDFDLEIIKISDQFLQVFVTINFAGLTYFKPYDVRLND